MTQLLPNLPMPSLAAAALSTVTLFVSSASAQELPPKVTLFKNVAVFDGVNDGLKDLDVLVVGNKIHAVAEDIPTSGTWEVEVETTGPSYSPIFWCVEVGLYFHC